MDDCRTYRRDEITEQEKHLTTTELKELRRIADNSTKVVGWYAHDKEVRGPFNRWFTCSEISPEYTKNVASTVDDCLFASAAMNNLVPLLDTIEQYKREADLLGKAMANILGGYKNIFKTFGGIKYWPDDAREFFIGEVAKIAPNSLSQAQNIRRGDG